MDQCPSCKLAVPSDKAECPFCGIRLSSAGSHPKEPEPMLATGESPNPGIPLESDMSSKPPKANLMLERNEEMLAQLSRGYLSNLVLGGSLSQEFVAVSDRRVYFSGSLFGQIGGKIQRLRGQTVIPLEHVSSTGFIFRGHFGLIGLAILSAMISLPVGILAAIASDGLSLLLFLLPCAFWLAYLFSRRRVYQISSNSATLEIDFKLYGEAAIRKFNEALAHAMTKHLAVHSHRSSRG